jgi:cytochrome P450
MAPEPAGAAALPYDPFDTGFQYDPYPSYRRLRRDHPVYRHPRGFWALSRFADLWDALHDPRRFSSAQGLTFHPDEIGSLGLAPTMVMLDPPRHTQLRRLVSRAFTPRRIDELEDGVRSFVRARLDEMAARAADGEEVDLHRMYSSPLPTHVLAELLGIPAADRHRLDPWVHALVRLQEDGPEDRGDGKDGDGPGPHQVVAELYAYFSALVADRRASPADDLISALTLAEVDGERLTDWDVLGFCFVMVAGGNDTTGNLISHSVALLDGAPDQRRRLAADPGLLRTAVLEFLRLEGSVQGLCRTVTTDLELHGVTIPAGDKVMLLYASGNRDETEFGPRADRLDVDRTIPRHLGFASGPHVCIGAHLARMQARVALAELLARFPEVGVDLDRGVRVHSAFTRGWDSLPATGLTG